MFLWKYMHVSSRRVTGCAERSLCVSVRTASSLRGGLCARLGKETF